MINLRLVVIAAATLSVINAFPTLQSVWVGELYQLSFPKTTSVAGADNTPLPSWLLFRNSILQGIPTEFDVGNHTVMITPQGAEPHNIVLQVKEEFTTACGTKDTFWIEAYFVSNATLDNRIEAALELTEEEQDSEVKTLRVYSFDYSVKHRVIEDLMAEQAVGNFVVIWSAACDDFDEATNVLDSFIERDDVDYDMVKMSKGSFVKSTVPSTVVKTPVESEEKFDDNEVDLTGTLEELEATTELIRTTRKVEDNRPIMLNRLPPYSCIRGELCELRVAPETFKDAEDGDTFKLKLTVVALDNVDIWMATESRIGMAGVPMKTGEYNYRLEARDKKGQMASAAFSVLVKPSLPTNHKVQFDLDIPSAEVMATSPQRRNMFVRAMARALKTPWQQFTLHEIGTKNNKTVITWSNNTLPYKTCDEVGLNTMSSKMIMKQKSRTKTEFVKAMGNNFYVRRASLLRLGNCEENLEVSTTAPTIESVQEADSQLIQIICILLACLLVIAIAVIVYCACLKKDGKKKSTSTEYVSKGLPIVFPDEVEDADPTNAGTPMLAREERPPLKVSQHENPLYKPPPPIASNSPRIGHASASSNQKMPPTFIPP